MSATCRQPSPIRVWLQAREESGVRRPADRHNKEKYGTYDLPHLS